MTEHPFINGLGNCYRRGRMIMSRLAALTAPLWDEGLRLALWWGMLMFASICILEICRWFWLVYPETVIGQRLMAKAELPGFANTVLHEPHWYTALFLVTTPCLASVALAWFGRFFYIKRLLYSPFGSILRTFMWATPIAAGTGYFVTEYLELTLQSAVVCAAGPSLAFVPQAFRTADRLCPELGDCIRWLRRGLRRLRRAGRRSNRVQSERLQGEHAHLL